MVLKLCIICRDWTIGKSNSDNFRLLLKSSSPYWQLSNVANAIYLLQNTEILEISSSSYYEQSALSNLVSNSLGEAESAHLAGLPACSTAGFFPPPIPRQLTDRLPRKGPGQRRWGLPTSPRFWIPIKTGLAQNYLYCGEQKLPSLTPPLSPLCHKAKRLQIFSFFFGNLF